MPPGFSSAVNACANALQWQHALGLLRKPPVPWHLQRKWLKQQKLSDGLLLILAGFCISRVHLQMCSLLRASSLWAKGGRKTLHETTGKSRRSPRRSPPVSTAFLVVTYFPCATFVGEHPSSGSKTSKNHQHHQHHPTDSDQLHSCSIIFPNFPHIFRFFPLRSPGFLQLQRQHQRLRALSALVRSPGPGEFPLGAAAAAQRHHVGCHRGRHAIKPGAPRGEVEELSPLPHLSGDGKSWEDLWIVLGKF